MENFVRFEFEDGSFEDVSVDVKNLNFRERLKIFPKVYNKEIFEILRNSIRMKSLPENVGNLKNLTSLDLGGIEIRTLPESIGSLINLTSLNLGSSQITTLPESIGNLTNLTYLNLGRSQITTLPESIGKLKNLASLDLNFSQISALPESIGSLKNLASLDLSHSQVTTLPESIGSLTNLTSLNLGSSQVTTLPENIGNLTNLTSLNLDSLQITTLPESIGNLTNLTSLNLSSSQITTLPESIGNLTNLTSLYLYHSQITKLPKSIGNLKKLATLDLSYSQVTTLSENIGNLTRLTSLDLSYLPITTLPESIGNLTRLTSLDLGESLITTLSESIGSLTNLTSLNLYYSSITTLPESIGSLTNLTSLNLSGSLIKTLPESIGNLTNLTSLDLGESQITTLPESIGNLTRLTSLDLSHLQITTLPESIGNLTRLTSLDLSHLQITTLPESIGNLINLISLNLSSSQITTLPKSLYESITLKELDISNTKVLGLSHISVESKNAQAILSELKAYNNNNDEDNTFRIKLGTNTKLNKALKTAVRQYFQYFEEYLYDIKGMDDIEVEVRISDTEFYLEIKGEEAESKSELITKYLEEFKPLYKINPDEIENYLHFEGVHSERDKKIAIIDAKHQIQNLLTKLEIAQVKIEDLNKIIDDNKILIHKLIEAPKAPIQIQINQSNHQEATLNNQVNIAIQVINNLQREIDVIRQDDFKEEEEKIAAIGHLLDNTPIDEEAQYEKEVRAWLPVLDNLLGKETKQYLVSAAFLLKTLQTASSSDYSPFLLQMCRAIEGELGALFTQYHSSFAAKSPADKTNLLAYDLQGGSNKFKAFVTQLNKVAVHFMMGDSEEILCKTSPFNAWAWGTKEWDDASKLKKDLLLYLDGVVSDKATLLSEDSINSFHNIRDNYRNKVAHPGETFSKEDAIVAHKEIKAWIKQWGNLLP